jgi:hypothetical protein
MFKLQRPRSIIPPINLSGLKKFDFKLSTATLMYEDEKMKDLPYY